MKKNRRCLGTDRAPTPVFPARLDYKAGSIACELLAEHVIGIENVPGITPILDDGRPFSF